MISLDSTTLEPFRNGLWPAGLGAGSHRVESHSREVYDSVMKLERLCSMDLKYVGGFHLARPYGNEAGLGWGVGEGSASGDRLAGSVEWSNHPSRRGDGSMLPNARGVVKTAEGAEVLFGLTGRTVFVGEGDQRVGRQLLMTLFESADKRYAWLNNTVCVSEGQIDQNLVVHLDVHLCVSELV